MPTYTGELGSRATELRSYLSTGAANVTDHSHPQYSFTLAAHIVTLFTGWAHITVPPYSFEFIGGSFCYCFDDINDVIEALDLAITHWDASNDISEGTRDALNDAHSTASQIGS